MTTTEAGPAVRLFAAFNTDVADPELIADGAAAWHNYDEQDKPLADGFALMGRIRAGIPDFRLDAPVFHTTGDVTVAQFVVRGTLPDGSALAVPSCLVVHTSGDRITRMEEYVDPARMAPVLRLLY